MQLGNIMTSIGGQITSRVEAKASDKVIGSVKVLMPKAISNGRIVQEYLSNIEIKTELDENKLTKQGDIIVKLNQPYDAAYISLDDEGLLVSSFCLIIRNIDRDIKAKYLLSVINSDLYREQALNMTSGATVPLLTKNAIHKIEMHIPSIEEQELVIQFSDEIKEKEEIFTKIINLEKQKLVNLLRGECNE